MRGNHDREKSFYLGEVIESRFYNRDDINVIDCLRLRKYIRYGNNLIGIDHGKTKLNKLPTILPYEVKREDWINSRNIEFISSHDHQKKNVEYIPSEDMDGILVRKLMCMCSKDSFHYERALNMIRGMQTILYSKDGSVTIPMNFNLNIEKEK